MGADHPIAWCKDYKGGRSFYTGVGDVAGSRRPAEHLAGAIQWAAGVADPVYSDCGATVAGQLPADEGLGAAEPQRADRLRRAPGRPRAADRARRPAAPARPGQGRDQGDRATMPVYTNSEDGLYGPAIDNDFATNKWVYLYYAPPTVRIRKCDGTTGRRHDPDGLGARQWPPTRASGRTRGRATSSSRASSSSTAPTRAGPRRASRRSCRSPTTAARAATSRATSTSTRTTTCGWSRATTRRPAAATPAASRPTTTR